jgi:serine protease Do
LVASLEPTVVSITTHQRVQVPRVDFGWPFSFFDEPNVIEQKGAGSGFVIDGEGHVVTNAHVVQGVDKVRVRLFDDRELDATVIGRDERLDVALLKVDDATNLTPARLGSSQRLRVGEQVLAIGNPFGLGHTVTMGIVSAKNRTIGHGPYDDFIQTDASINPGNSGGPLFNMQGEVVGINTAINPSGRGISFAIPIDALKEVLPQLLSKGHVSRAKLGVVIQPVDDALAKALHVGAAKGALVSEVEKGSAAEAAGIRPGDVILSVDGQPIAHSSDLPRIIGRRAPQSNVAIEILRDGKTLTLNAKLGDASGAPSVNAFGLVLQDRTGDVVVRDVVPFSEAWNRVRPGDILRKINRAPVSSASDATRTLGAIARGDAVLLELERNGAKVFVALEHR